ncbi:HAD family hydrolase [Kineococcus gynurae]|uniref:HAD family hydrolase n=1 Tax=Kineococcus gynurae TaxID=452979 RepID=A0ABV5LR09_9ACTN
MPRSSDPLLVLEPPAGAGCLLFDWDGTLADSTAANAAAFSAAVQPYGGEVSPDWFVRHAGLSAVEAVRVAALEQGLEVDEIRFCADRDRHYLARLGEVREVRPVADLARAQHGRRRLAVVSGGGRTTLLAGLRHLGLDHLFDVVVAREDAAHGKPAPDLYREALRRLGVPADRAVAYEDTDEGLQAAAGAGVAAIDVRPVRSTRRPMSS